jgi:hypothetical protein
MIAGPVPRQDFVINRAVVDDHRFNWSSAQDRVALLRNRVSNVPVGQ